jgi:hypothetical protein
VAVRAARRERGWVRVASNSDYVKTATEAALLGGLLVDYRSVNFGQALLVVHVPAKGLEERVEESKTASPLAALLAELGFVVVRVGEQRALAVEVVDQPPDVVGCA